MNLLEMLNKIKLSLMKMLGMSVEDNTDNTETNINNNTTGSN